MIPSPAWARAGGAAIDHPHGQLWDSEQPNAAGSSPLAALEWAGLRFRLVPLGSDQGPPDYWRHRVFAPSGIDHVSVPAGRYRITIFDEQGDLDTFEREVAPGAVTRLVR